MTQRSPYLKAADRVASAPQPSVFSYLIILLVVGAILGGLVWLNIEIWGSIF